MASSVIQRSLAGGEIAPALYGRADQTKYQTGLKTMRNMAVLKHGGAGMRSGLEHVVEVKDSADATYMIKFVFNDDQTYVIEVGDQYMRFIRNGAQIVVSGVAAWSNATNYVIGDLAAQGGVNYYCIAAHINQVPPNATYWYPLTGVIYEIPTPYLTADLERLKFVQSGDVVTITHPSYDVRELTRTGHTTWALTVNTFAPSIAAPGSPTNSSAGLTGDIWVITTVKEDSFEESLASSETEANAVATSGAPITVSWAAVTGAQEYNVYKKSNGIYGYIGTAGDSTFEDNGITPNLGITPPISRDPFTGSGKRPQTASYYQQRLTLAGSNTRPETVFAGRSGMFKNFSISSPLQDDDAVTFTIAGKKVNEVRHLVDLGVLVALTASSEYIIEGSADGILLATQPPNPRRVGGNGSAYVAPVEVNDSIVFLQARGTVLRDLRYTVSDGGGAANYKGRDLTVFAGHLFKNKTVTRMDYAQNPDSIIWVVRNDGVLLGLTYLPDHEVWGWHRHDTDGEFEDVCVVPEDDVDALYVIVAREINGSTKRYIERLSSRAFTDIAIDATFMDSFLSYDGRNTGATTLTLSTLTTWLYGEEITVTAAAGTPFVAGDVGNAFKLDIVVDGEITDTVTITITGYTSSTVVTGIADKDVPAALQGVATAVWTRMVDQLSGLDHLIGKDVSVIGDGHVVASPNNGSYVAVTVNVSGEITLDRPYGVIHVGLPYVADFQTLDLDIAGQQIRDRQKNLTHVSLLVEDTRGIFAGPRFPEDIPANERQDENDMLEGLEEPQQQPIVGSMDDPWPVRTDLIEIPIASTWRQAGSFVVRQVDPLPLTILSAIPAGDIGG